MDRVIIGIHGLRNKPVFSITQDWWNLSIRDGFDTITRPQLPFRFELVYWVDLLYPQPLDPAVTDENDPLYLNTPYIKVASPPFHNLNKKRQQSLERWEKISDRLFHSDRILNGFEGVTDRYIHSRFHDLEVYLQNERGFGEAQDRPVRDVILERLGNLLLKYRRKKIMLIAHSMGSIVAYDLLTQPDNPFHVHTLMTVGSPLGQPTIMAKFAAENPVVQKLTAPENVERWINISDLNDVVALDPTLADDFAPNSTGMHAVDEFVVNNYEWNGVRNPHAIYGYLQTSACAEYIYRFLSEDRSKFSLALAEKMQLLRDRLWRERACMLERSTMQAKSATVEELDYFGNLP